MKTGRQLNCLWCQYLKNYPDAFPTNRSDNPKVLKRKLDNREGAVKPVKSITASHWCVQCTFKYFPTPMVVHEGDCYTYHQNHHKLIFDQRSGSRQKPKSNLPTLQLKQVEQSSSSSSSSSSMTK